MNLFLKAKGNSEESAYGPVKMLPRGLSVCAGATPGRRPAFKKMDVTSLVHPNDATRNRTL